METCCGGTGEANPAAPIANEGTKKSRIRAAMSLDKLEMVCNRDTMMMIPTNMKQFGFMLGPTKKG